MSQEIFPVGTNVIAINGNRFFHGIVIEVLDVSRHSIVEAYNLQKYVIRFCDGATSRYTFEEVINLNENYVRTWKPKSSL